MLLLCNPHNPTGRVFTREELTRIGQLCVKHDVLIFADEIHGDLVYQPHRHLHIASLDDQFASRTLTFIAPSKTFNLAGLSTSVSIVPNPVLNQRLQAEYAKMHADQGNIFGAVALEAAYSHGDEWLDLSGPDRQSGLGRQRRLDVRRGGPRMDAGQHCHATRGTQTGHGTALPGLVAAAQKGIIPNSSGTYYKIKTANQNPICRFYFLSISYFLYKVIQEQIPISSPQ